MTTIPTEWAQTTGTLQEDRPDSTRCSQTIDLEIQKEPVRLSPRTTRTVGINDRAVAFVVITRQNRITVPLDVNWEIQRARNLAANKVRLFSDTTHEEKISAEATCPYPIE